MLDSTYPHLAPHIVVTHPENTWEDYFIPWQNRVDPQCHCHLTVPLQTWHASSSTNVSRRKDRSRAHIASLIEPHGSTKAATDGWLPTRFMTEYSQSLRIFSLGAFAKSV